MKVAVACQGGGMHAAFEVGVLTEILKDIRDKPVRAGGLERDVGRRPVHADGLVRPRS
jgi:hypothetical protein